MSNDKKDTLEKAFATALDALANNAGLSWIKKSCITERAYCLGILAGLSSTSEEHLLGGGIAQALMGTMWQRKADDTFVSTTIGRNHRQLIDMLRCGQPIGSEFQQTINDLERDIEKNDRKWRSLVQQIEDLMKTVAETAAEFETNTLEAVGDRGDENRYRLLQLLDYFEPLARKIALLETDHRIQSRFEE
jgi:hypothetical protein